MSYDFTVRGQLQDKVRYHAKEIGALSLIQSVMEELELLDVEFWPTLGNDEYVDGKSVPGPFVRLSPKHVLGVAIGLTNDGPTLSLVDTTPTLGDAALALLPKVGKWTKGYDADRNQISVTGYYKGVRIVIEDTPPDTCKVQEIEEDVMIPASEELIVKRRRYVLVGDCDPLTSARTVQPESAGGAAIAVDTQAGAEAGAGAAADF
jgi:hypothetical protein